jgi:hypothetical protein
MFWYTLSKAAQATPGVKAVLLFDHTRGAGWLSNRQGWRQKNFPEV